PNRCTLYFTATAQVIGNTDPTDNNPSFVELNVADKRDQSTQAPHETAVKSIKPLVVSIPKNSVGVTKFVHPVVVNADYLPPEPAGHTVTLSLDPVPVTCPWITEGSIDVDPATAGDQSSVLLVGGEATTRKVTRAGH